MLKTKHRRTIRHSLAITTALASGCWAFGNVAAQTLPGNGTTVATSPLGSRATITRSGNTMTVDLRATGTVIDWNGFNIANGSTVSFTDGTRLPVRTNIAVLNRDISGSSTNISGTLNAASNIAVWVYNARGILIGDGARIDTGSLVLTTLDPSDNFLIGNRYRLSGADDLTAGITVNSSARITVQGGNRGLILVAPKIESSGTLIGNDQGVAFVTATDVTLDYNTGSPLSVVLNKGTSVAGASQIVRGTVRGQDVLFAMATHDTVTDALLNVEASVMTATGSDRGIVLVAGKPASAVTGVTVSGTAAQTGGIVKTIVSGTLTTESNDTDIFIAGSGAINLTRTLEAARDVTVAAGGLASVTGAVTAGRDYVVSGTGVALGSAAAPVMQQATRNVSVTANSGTLTGLGVLTLLADSDGNGSGALTLATGGASGGDIAFGLGTKLIGGADGDADVRVRVRTAANAVALGDVTAGALLGAVGSANFAEGLSITGPLTIGDFDLGSALSLQSGTLTAGALTSDAGITLAASGAMVVASIDADGAVALTGTGTTGITGAATARGSANDIQILRTGAVTIGRDVSAGRDLVIGTTAAPVSSIATLGDLTARNISLISSGVQDLRGDVAARGTFGSTAGTALSLAGRVRAAGAITLSASGMTLADVASTSGALTARAGAGGVVGTTAAGAKLAAFDDLSVSSTGGPLGIAQAASARGAVSLTGTGISANMLNGAGDVTVDGAQGIVAVSGAVTAGGAYRVTGGTVTLGAAGAVTQAANGLVTISAGAGGITGLGALTLRSNNDGAGTEALTLAIAETARDGAIAFAPASILLGGPARQSDVEIRSGSAAGIVTLGSVDARGLLGAVGADAFTDGLARTSAITVADIRLARALLLNGAGVSADDLTSDGAVTLVSAGPLGANSIDAGGNIAMSGMGGTTITGLVQTRGVGRDVTIDRGGDLRIGSIQASGAVAIGRDVAPATLDIGAASSGGAFTAISTGAQTWRGAIVAAGAVDLSGQSLDLGGVRSSAGAITLTSTNGLLKAGAVDGAGLVTLTSSDALSATAIRGGGGVRGTGVGDVTITGLVDGGTGGVAISGTTLGLRDVRATAGAVSLTADGSGDGDGLTAGVVDGAGLTTLTSAGLLTATAVRGGAGVRGTADKALTIGALTDGGTGGVSLSGASLELGGVRTTAGAVSLTTTSGALSAGEIDGGGLTTLKSAGALTAASVRGGGGVSATAAGDVTIAGLIDGGTADIAISAMIGTARLTGGVTAEGDYRVTARTVTLGGTQMAGGAVAIDSLAGAVTGLSGLVLTANSDGIGGEALALDTVGGGIELAIDSVLNGGTARQSDIVLQSAGDVTLGGVNARSLRINDGRRLTGAVATGSLSLAQGMTLLGGVAGVRTGAITTDTGNLLIDALGGTVSVGAIAAGGTVDLSGAAVRFTTITGSAVTLQSIGAAATGISGGNISATGPVTLTALSGSGGVTTGAITTTGAAGAVTISSIGDVQLASVTAGGTATITTQTNPADILIAGGVSADGSVQLTSSRDIRAPFVRSAVDLIVLAPNGSLTGFTPGSTIELTVGPGSGFTVDIGEAVRLGALTGGPLSLRADSIEIASIDVGTNLINLFADSGDLRIDGNVRGGTVTLASTGLTSVGGAVTASGALTLTGGTLGLRTGDLSGSSIAMNSTAAITGGVMRSNGVFGAEGTEVTLGSITAGGVATLDAKAGTLNVGAVIAAGLDARASGNASITKLDVAGGSARFVSTAGAARLGAATVSGTLTVEAAGSATLAEAVSAGGDYTVRGASIVLGGAPVTQSAGRQIALTAGSGGISGAAQLRLLGNTTRGTSAMLIDSAGQIALASTTIDNGGGALGLRAGSGAAVEFGTIGAGAIGGIVTAADGSVSATDTFGHDGTFTAGDIVARDIAVTLTTGALRTGNITTSGATRLATGGAITTAAVTAAAIDVDAGTSLAGGSYRSTGAARLARGIQLAAMRSSAGDITATARSGALKLDTIDATNAATIAGQTVAIGRLVAGGAGTVTSDGGVRTDSATAATLAITAKGDITGLATDRALLSSTSGDLTVDGGALVRLGAVGSVGRATISGGDVDMAGTLSVARAALIKARQALTAGDISAGGALTLEAGGALSAGALRATGDALVTTAGNVQLGGLDTGGALTIKGGDITMGTGRAAGVALVDATGLATLGQLVAGPTLTIRAADATLNGVQRAASVAFETRGGDGALRLGDGTANDGFRLSDAEVKLVEADAVTFQQGSGAVEIGTLSFGADSGRLSVDILGTGAIAVQGVASGSGTGRRFRLGGDASDSGMAREINVVATSDAGGRLLFDGADLELRGGRIAVGVAPGFIDALSGASFDQVVSDFVGNANSSLYNANIGGSFYEAAATTTLSARSLTVRYGEYALFQNTSAAGKSTGLVLGGTPAAPVSPALTLLPQSAAGNAFAAFGTINGVSDTAAALLGGGIVSLGTADPATTRLNGCLVGSGAGCLSAIVIQPTLQVFETTQQDVFGSVETVDVPFDPVVSGSNEELLTGLATMGPRGGCEEGDGNCAAAAAGETAK